MTRGSYKASIQKYHACARKKGCIGLGNGIAGYYECANSTPNSCKKTLVERKKKAQDMANKEGDRQFSIADEKLIKKSEPKKGQKSKTMKGKEDFTTKKGSKDFNRGGKREKTAEGSKVKRKPYSEKKKEKTSANTHKMPDGSVMSGAKHSKDSKVVKKAPVKKKAPKKSAFAGTSDALKKGLEGLRDTESGQNLFNMFINRTNPKPPAKKKAPAKKKKAPKKDKFKTPDGRIIDMDSPEAEKLMVEEEEELKREMNKLIEMERKEELKREMKAKKEAEKLEKQEKEGKKNKPIIRFKTPSGKMMTFNSKKELTEWFKKNYPNLPMRALKMKKKKLKKKMK